MAFVVSHRQTWSHNVVSSTARMSGIRTHKVSGDRNKSNYYTITTTTAPGNFKDDGLRWLNVEGI
jgi:hypothetical protein